ncbi:hypothetical protein Cal7507_5395 [Calothrix sp. PCC 7507]|nr:hypothetical protein Cal7507_5395 [Calothrix sp. PCC 7507]
MIIPTRISQLPSSELSPVTVKRVAGICKKIVNFYIFFNSYQFHRLGKDPPQTRK